MLDFKFFKGQVIKPLYWKTAMGEYKLVSEMTSEHIFNICFILTHGTCEIPDPYLGKTNEEWLKIFEDELKDRTNGLYENL
jgi:hypothetical protein